jgi:hypothetical protein
VSSSSGARCSSSRQPTDAINSGGPPVGHCSGASLRKPTCSSIFLATPSSVISAIAFFRRVLQPLALHETSMLAWLCD